MAETQGLLQRGDSSDRQTAMEGGGKWGGGVVTEIEERLAEMTVANISKVCQLAF